MSAYTPSPWTIDNGAIYGTRGLIRPFVASVEDDHNDGETAANARLIASAPDMLEALQNLVDYLGADVDNGLDELLTKARTAIEKATKGVTL